MTKIKSLFTLLAIIATSYLITSCNTKNRTSYSYLIQVDSIHVPDNITAKTAFEVDFYGFVGPSGCYFFESFNQSLTTTNDIMMEVWGRYESETEICPTVLVYLDRHADITISTAGTYNIKIRQPDNTYLVKQITVN
jgi:hypothetical protein